MEKVDIIIPVYKPDESFFNVIDLLEHQSYPVNQIIIMNTEQKYWDRLLFGKPRLQMYSNIKVFHISKREFDHGMTRRRGIEKSDASYFIMMTQDAMPENEKMIEELVSPLLLDQNIAASYARQLPNQNAGLVETFTRLFNYPEESKIKRKEDIDRLGIKTYFCSNVCAAYNRTIYDKLGGFVKEAIFNEDMIYAAKCIKNDYGIAYVAKACVYHSHQYTNKIQFQRNFDLGVSQADHPEIFEAVPAESEGMKMVSQTAAYLREKGQKNKIVPLYITSACKWIGYKLGKNYKRLSKKQILRYTMNREYWINHWSR